ncbi:MAG TPA: hypothetical protein IGR64_11350 [Leptolyngbyaceae cyanobacterium M65_K2018_010]|nr:hypothetical protein [Leptolyngbyaceae cyanobacterium M65_K2018_010]
MAPTTATPTRAPVRKVTFGAVSGALVTLIVGILNTYVPFFEAKPISGEISGALTTVVSFLVSYMVPPDPTETVLQNEEGKTRSGKI